MAFEAAWAEEYGALRDWITEAIREERSLTVTVEGWFVARPGREGATESTFYPIGTPQPDETSVEAGLAAATAEAMADPANQVGVPWEEAKRELGLEGN